jgi:hypothetical protein
MEPLAAGFVWADERPSFELGIDVGRIKMALKALPPDLRVVAIPASAHGTSPTSISATV